MTTGRRLILKLGMLGLMPFSAFAVCRQTEPNALGPFYRRDAPFRSAIAAPDEPGQVLRVAGKVSGVGGCRPLAGAVVDIWHANEEGQYYDVGSEAGSDPQGYRLRGRLLTSGAGEYEFLTILPGTYGSRPRHIHYVVHHPQAGSLITQLYFEGDPRLDSDFLARESLVMAIDKSSGDTFKIRFDIVLGG